MKTSVAVLAAAAGLAMAKPEFLNTKFDVTPGEDFTLKFKGCESGCEIELLNGDPDNLQPVQNLTPNGPVDGSEYTFSLSDKFNKDTYAFRITAEDDKENPNYSEQFNFEGQEVPETTSAAAETTSAETSSAEETTTAEETTITSTSAEETTTMTTVVSSGEMTSTPEASTATETESETTTSGADAEETSGDSDSDSDNQDGAAARLGSSHVTFVVAAVAALGYFL